MKRIIIIALIALIISSLVFILPYVLVPVLSGRDIIRIEIGEFPNNIAYYVGESDSVDLTGGTVLIHTRGGTVSERRMDIETVTFSVVYDVDFSVPGVYEVYIIWIDYVVRFPVQVIERE